MTQDIKFVSWIKHHGRTEDICTVMEWTPIYLFPEKSGFLSRERRYIESIKQSRAVYKSTDNRTTATMLPPPIMPLINRADKNTRHIYDIHSGLFTDRRWRIFLRSTLKSFRSHDILLAHNKQDEQILQQATKSHVVMLQDPALTADTIRTERSPNTNTKDSTLSNREDSPIFIFPSSGDTDEPLSEFDTATTTHFKHAHVSRIIVTGTAAVDRVNSELIATPGFLPRTQYEEQIRASSIVVSLSTRPDILQRAAFEALVAGKRPVVCESASLRGILGDFAVYATGCQPAEIGAALDAAWLRRDVSDLELRQTRERILSQETTQIQQLQNLL